MANKSKVYFIYLLCVSQILIKIDGVQFHARNVRQMIEEKTPGSIHSGNKVYITSNPVASHSQIQPSRHDGVALIGPSKDTLDQRSQVHGLMEEGEGESLNSNLNQPNLVYHPDANDLSNQYYVQAKNYIPVLTSHYTAQAVPERSDCK